MLYTLQYTLSVASIPLEDDHYECCQYSPQQEFFEICQYVP